MDHAHDMTPVDGPWAGGWAIAALAGLFAVAVAKMLGEVGTAPAALIGAVTFLVHGVLLGSGGVERTADAGEAHDAGPAHH